MALQWRKLVSTQLLGGSGSSGVFLVTFSDDTPQHVVKGSSYVASELFATLLFNTLRPCTSPTTKLLKFNEDDWSLAKKAMANTVIDNVTALKLAKELNRPYLLLMEYLPDAHSLDALIETYGIDVSISMLSRPVIHGIGWIMAVDLLIRNFDRVPSSVFKSDGNLGNIVLRDEHVYAIDQVISCISIDHKDTFVSYIDAVMAMVEECIRFADSDSQHVPSSLCLTVDRMYIVTGKRLSIKDVRVLCSGIQAGVRDIMGIVPSLLLKTILEQLDCLVTTDWHNVWHDSIASISLPFLRTVYEAIRTGYWRARQPFSQPPSPLVCTNIAEIRKMDGYDTVCIVVDDTVRFSEMIRPNTARITSMMASDWSVIACHADGNVSVWVWDDDGVCIVCEHVAFTNAVDVTLHSSQRPSVCLSTRGREREGVDTWLCDTHISHIFSGCDDDGEGIVVAPHWKHM